MFDFSDSLSAGYDKASELVVLREEFDSVFSTLEKNLSEFIKKDVKINHFYEYEDDDPITSAFTVLQMGKNVRKKTGYFKVSLEDVKSKNKSDVLFKYKESKEIFPVNVVFQNNEMRCDNQDELVDALKGVVSKGQFNLKIRKFIDALES